MKRRRYMYKHSNTPYCTKYFRSERETVAFKFLQGNMFAEYNTDGKFIKGDELKMQIKDRKMIKRWIRIF